MGLQCWTKIWATWATVDVSKYLEILPWEVSKMLKRPPSKTGCTLILRPLLVLRILVVLLSHPILVRPSFVTPMIQNRFFELLSTAAFAWSIGITPFL